LTQGRGSRGAECEDITERTRPDVLRAGAPNPAATQPGDSWERDVAAPRLRVTGSAGRRPKEQCVATIGFRDRTSGFPDAALVICMC
jgi:hypothetical protein